MAKHKPLYLSALMLPMSILNSFRTSTSMMVGVMLNVYATPSQASTPAEDETNMHRHARNNAQAAIALAKKKAQEFDTQAALERKTNEAIKLAKRQAHIRADEDVDTAAEPTEEPDQQDTLRLPYSPRKKGSVQIVEPIPEPTDAQHSEAGRSEVGSS